MGRRRTSAGEADDRPPICPACGVTQGMVVTHDHTEFVCLECGFSDDRDPSVERLVDSRRTRVLE